MPGARPLMHAAAFGNLETMKVLLDAGADAKCEEYVRCHCAAVVGAIRKRPGC